MSCPFRSLRVRRFRHQIAIAMPIATLSAAMTKEVPHDDDDDFRERSPGSPTTITAACFATSASCCDESSQRSPEYPGAQLQRADDRSSPTRVPPFSQTTGKTSFGTVQRSPCHGPWHKHVYSPNRSLQTPPLAQGSAAQLSKGSCASQRSPPKLGGQTQRPSTQVPPLLHTSSSQVRPLCAGDAGG
jgi:hypothetical protein